MTTCENAALPGEYVAGKTYYVYIMANNTRTLYTGVTGNQQRRASSAARQPTGTPLL